MTAPEENTISPDPIDSILVDLRTTDDDPQQELDEDPGFDALLSHLPAPALNSDVLGVVQQLIPGAWPYSMPIDRRSRLLNVVETALAERKRDTGLLQSVLRSRRLEDGRTTADVAEAVNHYLPKVKVEEADAVESVDANYIDQLETAQERATSLRAFTVLSIWAADTDLSRTAWRAGLTASIRWEDQPAELKAAGGRHAARSEFVDLSDLERCGQIFDKVKELKAAEADTEPS